MGKPPWSSGQTWASYIFGILTVLVIVLLIPHTNWHALLARPTGPWLTGFLPALTIVIAASGLSWANAAADYRRYLPRSARSSSIVWSTTLGGAIPLIILMLTGTLLATHESTLATAANPIGVIQAALPAWAAVPYLIAAAGELIVEADLSLYSSGLNLLNMFVPFARYKTVAIDAGLMALGTVHVVLIAQNFIGPFESFIVLLGVGLAAWAGIFLAHQFWRSGRSKEAYPQALLYDAKASDGRVRGGVSWAAIISWLVAVGVGLLFTTSPFFSGPLATGIFAESSLEVVFAFVVGAVLCLILTSGWRGDIAASDAGVPTSGR